MPVNLIDNSYFKLKLTSVRGLITLLGLELEPSLLVELRSCRELESEPSDIDLGDSGSLYN